MIITYKEITPAIHSNALILPETTLIGDVEIDEDSSVWFRSVLRGDIHYIRIGRNSNLQDGTIVHTGFGIYPALVGDNVTIGHGALIHGTDIKDSVLIGMGAILLNGSVVNKGSIVAAGALIRENFVVPPRTLAAGVPAKIIRDVTDEEYDAILKSADHYHELAKTYITVKREKVL